MGTERELGSLGLNEALFTVGALHHASCIDIVNIHTLISQKDERIVIGGSSIDAVLSARLL